MYAEQSVVYIAAPLGGMPVYCLKGGFNMPGPGGPGGGGMHGPGGGMGGPGMGGGMHGDGRMGGPPPPPRRRGCGGCCGGPMFILTLSITAVIVLALCLIF